MNPSTYILIADDDLDDQLLFTEAFEQTQLPLEISFVLNGAEAIEFLENNNGLLPEFILLDLNMPRLDGYATLQYLKASASFRNIPTYIISTSGAAYDQDRCLAAGADEYIIKPHQFDAMVAIIQQLANRSLVRNK